MTQKEIKESMIKRWEQRVVDMLRANIKDNPSLAQRYRERMNELENIVFEMFGIELTWNLEWGLVTYYANNKQIATEWIR